MIEQWFLDLDGVRSGPYQTPEVMSLIAEGEVLPHHRISTSLRDQKWVTILDWRLDQAKISAQTPNPSPFSKSRSEVSSVEGLEYVIEEVPEAGHFEINEPGQQIPPPQHEVSPPRDEISPPHDVDSVAKPAPKPAAPAQPSEAPAPAKTAPQSPAPVSPPPAKPAEPKLPPAPAAETPVFQEVNTPAPPPTDGAPRPKRDPMGEMFDLLQNTKQKTASKQKDQALSGILIEHDVPTAEKSNGLMRTLMIGAGITLVGFALGQLFQQSAPPAKDVKDAPAAMTKASPFATPPASTPTATGTAEVIDRSTDKMMIRTTLSHARPDSSPTKITVSKGTHTAAENVQNEKELEELKNLKKELQELKALKNNGVEDDTDIVGPESDGFDAKEPGSEFPRAYPPTTGGIPSTYQSEGEAGQPSQAAPNQPQMEQPQNR